MKPKALIEILKERDFEIFEQKILSQKIDYKILFTSSTTNDNHEIWDNLLAMIMGCIEKIIDLQQENDFMVIQIF